MGRQRGCRGVYLALGGDPLVTDGELGTSLLTLAAYAGHGDIVETLLDAGVDIDSRDRHGNTALHAAAYVGDYDVFSLLASHDARRDIPNRGGRRPADMADVGWPVTELVSQWMNIELHEAPTVAGKQRISTELGRAPDQEDDSLLAVIWEAGTTVPLFLHLWFLWYLWWMTVLFAACVWLGRRLNLKLRAPQFILSPACFLVLLPLTMIPGWFMHEFGVDTLITVIPDPDVFFYVLFFGFGVLYYECHDTTSRLGRRWGLQLLIGLLLVFPPALDLATGVFGFTDGLVGAAWQRPVCVLLEAAFA